ncbi:hypothetical protein SAMN04488035_0048 [Flavimobilis marinus]|uniref:Uncharacterized protein n=2 Tax=Flavimobilis marinus TaxID=285351 RepID=A0A1I2CB84_9MICO|nr:hypothetical protein SAMN04488035_0048 [Flavimobilis marinus]
MMDGMDISVQDNKDRFEARRGDGDGDGELVGYVEYRRDGDVWDLHHTQVLPEFEGQGVAGTLVAEALDQIRAAGGTVIASCSYVDAFLERRQEYADLRAR